MFTSANLRNGATISGPNAPAPQRIVTEPLALTPKRLHDALYCCAPCGPAVLSAHLQRYGIDNSKAAIEKALAELSATVTVSSVMSETIGGRSVVLWTLPGQGA